MDAINEGCATKIPEVAEDVRIAQCLQKVGIYPQSTLDDRGSEFF